MPSLSSEEISFSNAVLINVASAVTGISKREINRLIDDEVLPESAFTKEGSRRALRASAVPMVSFGASDGAKLSKSVRLEVMSTIEEFAKENWSSLCADPDFARHLRFESGGLVVYLGEPVSTAMAGLKRWRDALKLIDETSDLRGGIPVVSGTRVSVYEAAEALEADGMEVTLEDFPTLNREKVEAAALFASVFPRRGRPRKHSEHLRLVSEESVELTIKH